MTGHKSTEMVRRYIKEANLFKNNALNKIKYINKYDIHKLLSYCYHHQK